MNLQRFRNLNGAPSLGIANQRRTSLVINSEHLSASWESFVGLWDRANLIRDYLWNHSTAGNKKLLTQSIVRVRRFFGADFIYGSVILNGASNVEVAVPEAGISRLPSNFSRRCLDLVASSRSPIAWNESNGQFGFRSTVMVPLAPPMGRPFGFLMLGHSSRRSYSAAELFLLQVLGGELSWALRDLAAKQKHLGQLADVSHDVKNALQIAIGNAAMIRQKLKDFPGSECDKHLVNIESSVEEILKRLGELGHEAIDDDRETEAVEEAGLDIGAEVAKAIDLSRATMLERCIEFELICTPRFLGEAANEPLAFKQFLASFVAAATCCTRHETMQLAAQCDGSNLELAVKGLGKAKSAEKLKSFFEPPRSDAPRDDISKNVDLIKEYLEDIGGDAYLRSRPGQGSEFVVCVPISGKECSRATSKNED